MGCLSKVEGKEEGGRREEGYKYVSNARKVLVLVRLIYLFFTFPYFTLL